VVSAVVVPVVHLDTIARSESGLEASTAGATGTGVGGAVLLGIHDEWVAAERRYFSESSISKLYRVVD
jgi:hypothetical protein